MKPSPSPARRATTRRVSAAKASSAWGVDRSAIRRGRVPRETVGLSAPQSQAKFAVDRRAPPRLTAGGGGGAPPPPPRAAARGFPRAGEGTPVIPRPPHL